MPPRKPKPAPAQRKAATTSPARLHGFAPLRFRPNTCVHQSHNGPTHSRGAPSWNTASTTQAALALAFEPRRPTKADDLRPGPDWWHTELANRDAALLAALSAAVAANNGNVAALANGLSLGVRTTEVDPAYRAVSPIALPKSVLQYDAMDMARRIEEAAAKHKNRPRNGRSDNQNRNLKYVCPTCTRPIRSAGSTRIIMCGGTFEVPHAPAVCAPDEMPLNRAQDALAASGDIEPDAFLSKTGDQSTAQQAAHVKRQREIVNAAGIVQNNPAPRDYTDIRDEYTDIPF